MKAIDRIYGVAKLLLAFATVLWVCAVSRGETRYHQYCRKSPGSDGRVRPLAATFFGGLGVERFVAAGFAADGTIIAVGDAWGPAFPDVPGLDVIGVDRPVDKPPYQDAERKKLDEAHPGIAGFAVRFTPDLKRVVAAFRFGWGAGTATHACFAADGKIYLSGKCSSAFGDWLQGNIAQTSAIDPPEGAKAGGADLYLACLSDDDFRIQWAIVFRQAEAASAAWERRVGRAPGIHAEYLPSGEFRLIAYDRLYRLNTDGRNLQLLGETGGGVLWAVDTTSGAAYVGGDENTNTGREPWRRPFLRKFDRQGRLVWEIWRWDSKRVGTDRYRLVSDSSVRHVVPRPNGELVVAGWSDGGNSVFNRQPRDLDAQADYKSGFIDSLWGAGVGTFMRVMRITDDAPSFQHGSIWCSFLTERNKPNSLWIDDMRVLPDDRIVLAGRSAFAAIESPDAWIKNYPDGGSGGYFAIFRPDLGTLEFSTLLPPVTQRSALAVGPDGKVLIASGGSDANSQLDEQTGRGYQPTPGGDLDGWLLLIDASTK